MLFDIHDDPVDGKKSKKARRPAGEGSPAAAADLPAFRPQVLVATRPLGQIDDVFECADEACGAGAHEIIDEYAGMWSISCLFCGTGQTVKAIRGYLKPRTAEFVFQAGDYAGMPISAVAADPRGKAYIEWAAEEHKSQPVKDACKTFLDAQKPAP